MGQPLCNTLFVFPSHLSHLSFLLLVSFFPSFTSTFLYPFLFYIPPSLFLIVQSSFITTYLSLSPHSFYLIFLLFLHYFSVYVPCSIPFRFSDSLFFLIIPYFDSCPDLFFSLRCVRYLLPMQNVLHLHLVFYSCSFTPCILLNSFLNN